MRKSKKVLPGSNGESIPQQCGSDHVVASHGEPQANMIPGVQLTAVATIMPGAVASDDHDSKDMATPPKKSMIKSAAKNFTNKLLESRMMKSMRSSNSRSSTSDESVDSKEDNVIYNSTQSGFYKNSETSELTKTTSSIESSNSRLNIEPIKAQIVSYFKLLRKMSTNHP